MYKEIEKYKTCRIIPTTYYLTTDTTNTIIINSDEYKANYGDLINDYLNHKNKPFYKRKYYHKHLTEIYIKMLNVFSIKFIL